MHNTNQKNPYFTMRGENMSRIETFVAAAFAFAITMLIISLGDIPKEFDQFLYAVKQIPAFIASCAIIMWIWHSHASWCRRYGLEDTKTVFLSGALIILVLVYIYPLRMMMQGLFAFITNGFIPHQMQFEATWQVRFMFSFYAVGFICLCLNFALLFAHALKKHKQLALSAYESFETRFELVTWLCVSVVCLLSLVLAISLPINWIFLSGFSYFLLFPLMVLLQRHRQKQAYLIAQTATKNNECQ